MTVELERVKSLQENEVPIERYIPQKHHVSKYVVKTDSGEYQALFRVGGLSFDCMSDQAKEAFHAQLIGWIGSSLSGGEFGLTTYRVRSRINTSMRGDYNNDFSELLAEQYYSSFSGSNMLQTSLYLCISFKPAIDRVTRQLMKAMSKERIKKLEDESIAKLEDACLQTKKSLNQFGLDRLGIYERDGRVYSEFKNFLAFLVNGEWSEFELLRKDFKHQISYAKNGFKDCYRSVRTARGTRYAAYADFTDYPEFLHIGGLNQLLYSKFEFVETMTFRPSSLKEGVSRLDRAEGYMVSSGDVTENELNAFYVAKEAQKEGKLCFGDYTYSIAVFGDSFEEAMEAKSDLFGLMAEKAHGFTTAVIDISASAFLAQLPGNWDWAPRVSYISDSAFAGMSALHNFATGKAKGNPWGDAVTILKTPSKQPYFFNFHVTPDDTDNEDDKAPGNTVIIGQTGSGKTVLEAFLCSHLMKVANVRGVFFDKDRGLEPFVRRVNGKYKAIRIGERTGINPFQGEEKSPRYVAHLNQLFLLAVSDLGPVSITERKQLADGINAVFELPKHMRGVTALLQNLPENGTELAQKLRPWAVGDDGRDVGGCAWVFDNPRDELEFDSHSCYGFDYTELVEYEHINAAVMFHLLYRIENMLDGRPFFYVIAEFWKALMNTVFTEFAKNKQKTIRKQNGFGIFDTQEPEDMIKSTIGGTMVQQSVTKIFLPNREGVWEDYKRMGCSEKEFQIIKSLTVESRQFIVKQGHATVLAQLDLGGMSEVLDILSGSTDNVEILEDIIGQVGEDPKNWVGPYFSAIAKRRNKVREVELIVADMGEAEFTVEG